MLGINQQLGGKNDIPKHLSILESSEYSMSLKQDGSMLLVANSWCSNDWPYETINLYEHAETLH